MIIDKINTECTHCGLPVPTGLQVGDRHEQYCCHGCETAHQLIMSAGLESFYAMVDASRESQTLLGRGGDESQFDHLNDEGFQRRFAGELSGGVKEIQLSLSGIHCAACIWLIEKLPTIVSGVLFTRVNWSKGTVRVQWLDSQVSLSEIAVALFRLGYTPEPIRTSIKAQQRDRENRQQLARIGMAGAAAGNNMLIAAALYLGMFSAMDAGFVTLFRWMSCVIGIAALVGPGRVFLSSGWQALKTLTPHMDLPIALGLMAGTINGLINTVRGRGEIYFDSLTVLIFLLLIGRWIQFRQQNRAADSIEMLYRLTPQRARRIVDEVITEVEVDEIQPGDRLEIRPGDLFPTDATLVQGTSHVDESILTGESRSVVKQPGDPLSAGTKNLTSPLIACATAVGRDARIAKIVDLVEQAALEKPEIVQWANRIGGYFVVIVIFLAVITFLIWFQTSVDTAMDNAIALLVIACPCALAMATPLAISVALGRLAKRKTMVKSGDALQSLTRPGMIWLDKTGTLTEGQMNVTRWIGDHRWIPLVGAIEAKFTHPVARAINQFAQTQNTQTSTVQLSSSAGLGNIPCQSFSNGVYAQIDQREFWIGNAALMEQAGIDFENSFVSVWLEQEKEILSRGQASCWVAIDGEIVGLCGLGDRLRPDSAVTLKSLRNQGWRVGILSGDHEEVVRRVAEELRIDEYHAGATPEQKLKILTDSNQRFATSVMVGDGVNDSAALAAATVGIAVHNGAEASLAAAPIYLGESGLKPILDLINTSRSTGYTIKQNLSVSLGYNVLGVILAMMGVLHPLLAAALMPISSLSVIGLSLRSGRSSANQAG